MAKKCGCTTSSKETNAKTLAARAMKLALSLPDDVTCRKNFAPPEAEFLSALRDLAADYSLAAQWTESEARSHYEAMRFADAAMGYAFAARINNGGGGDSPSCTSRCVTEKDNCRTGCDNDPEAGYFCYFDCRLAYMACLAGCVHGGFSGGNGPVIA
ncbi:hypothetical protein MVG78_00090 [Roseomonas gilardii subsp. gilardii]|uniref:hypothetical protein n=1 Tax=Roseomonas gilardii TaxID=257708 RepID=UPI001FFB5633|nr:hypothetical protein [Roseomonas gilardii]UPG72641.1 hypothetical protein MVG78_00090 [Roseomonas gilardii subsp. gilardii]